MPIWNPAVAIPVRGLADLTAIERTPFEEITSLSSVYEILQVQSRELGTRPAIVFMPTADPEAPSITLTFGELFARVTQAANLFHRLADGAPPVVAILLPALPQAHVALWGGAAAGVAAPLNFLLAPSELAALLVAMKATVLVALGPHPLVDIWQKVEAIRDRVPTLRAIVQVATGGSVPEGVHAFDAEAKAEPADRLVSGRRFSRDDVAAYFHTGGTTGLPKLARHTNRNHIAAAFGLGRGWGFEPGEGVMNGLPIFHVGGALNAGLAPLAAGAFFLLMTPSGLRNPEVVKNIWRIIDKHGLAVVGGVPTSISAMLQVPTAGADLSRVKAAVTGGSPLPVDRANAFEQTFGIKGCEVYAMTETCGNGVVTPRHTVRVPGSAGLRVPYVEIKVAALTPDGAVAAACAPGESGVLLFRGPTVTTGYTDARLDRGVLLPDGWLVSGDLGRVTADGQVYITGRAKDLIIRGGHNIDPAIIEEAIEGHAAVMMGAAVGMPDEYAGEVPALFVKLKPGSSATPEELVTWLAERIPERAAVPKAIKILAELPLTSVGKIFKPALRGMLIEEVFGGRAEPVARTHGASARVVARHDASGIVAVIVLTRGSERVDEALVEKAVGAALGGFEVAHAVQWETSVSA